MASHTDEQASEQPLTELGKLRQRMATLETRPSDQPRAEEVLSRYAQRLSILYWSDHAILTAQPPEKIAQAALDRFWRLVPFQHAMVVEFTWQTQQAAVLAVRTRGTTQIKEGTSFAAETFGGLEDLRQGRIHEVKDIRALTQAAPLDTTLLEEGVDSYVSVPLTVQGDLIGLLTIGADSAGSFSAESIDIAREVATGLAVALQIARLHEQIELHAVELEQHVTQRTEELEESKHFIERIADTTPSLLYLYDVHEQRSVYLNRQVTTLLGYPPEHIAQDDFALFPTLLHPDDRASFQEHLQQLSGLQEGQFLETEYRLQHQAGEWRWFSSRDTVFTRTPEGTPQRILGSAQDVTERKQTAGILHEREEQFRSLFNNNFDGILITTPDGRIFAANPAACQIFGQTETELCQSGVGGLVDLRDTRFRTMLAEHARTGEFRGELTFRRKDGTIFPAALSSILFTDADEQKRIAIMVRDIGDQKHAEGALHDSEQRYQLLAEYTTDMISRQTPDGFLLSVSPACRTLLSMEADELIGQSLFGLVHAEDADALAQGLAESTEQRAVYTAQYRLRRADASYVLVEATSQAMLDPDGQIQEFLTVTREISGQKAQPEVEQATQQEAQQESSVQFAVPTEGSSRAEILLKEIHHRVKNNLQIVSSLLNLQSRSVSDTQTLDIMQESRSRIESIALIHEKLYQAQDLTQVDFADYIRDLSASLFRTYESAASGITFTTDLDSVLLDIDTAIPCGLMLNELVTNALKHAFPGERTGEVRIALHTLQQADGSHIVLTVADTGQGMPADLDIQHTRSLGFQLINALTSQIGGTLEVQREAGTEVTIRFPAPQPTGETGGETPEHRAEESLPSP